MPSAVCMPDIMVPFALMTKKLPQARRQRKGMFFGCFGHPDPTPPLRHREAVGRRLRATITDYEGMLQIVIRNRRP